MGELMICGVCGGTGAGKTTLVGGLVQRLGHDRVSVIAFDSYYHDLSHLDPADRDAVNYDHPAALDVDLFVGHLDALRSGSPVEVPVYDFATHTRPGPTVRVEPRPVVIVDGILLLVFAQIRARLDLSIFLDVSADIRFARRLRRDIAERGRSEASVREQWATSCEPMHRRYVEPSAAFADVVVDRFDELNRQAVIDQLAAMVRDAVAPTAVR